MENMCVKLKSFMNKRVILMLTLSMIFSVVVNYVSINAANEQFTMGAIPTVRQEVVYNGASTTHVANKTDFITAYKNASISRIVLDANLTFIDADELQMATYTLTRSLQIDGAGFSISHPGARNPIFQINAATSAKTLHFKNIEFTKTGANNLNNLIQGGSTFWDVIMDGVKITTGNKYGHVLSGTAIHVFFRNSGQFLRHYDDFMEGLYGVVFEENSNYTINASVDTAATFWDNDGTNDAVVHFGKNSVADIEGSNSYPVFYPWKQFNLYEGADVYLHKLVDTEGVQDSYGVNQVYRIDSNSKLKMENASGPALYDWGNPIDIKSNSNASVQFIGNKAGIGGGVWFADANSKLILDTPKFFNIQNKSIANSAFSSSSTTNPALQIINANIGAWNKNISQTGAPTSPSPFNNVSLFSGNTTTLAGTTAILNTMSGGWNTSNYSKMAFATKPTVSAANITMSINKTKNINPTYAPADATVTYLSNNTSIATVNSSGVVSSVAVGTTTIRVTVTSPEGITAFVDINVTVTNNPPILTVPTFTQINVGDSFNPLTGVTATDPEDGNLINDVVVTGSVNTATAGVYTLNYSVKDSDNNTVTAKQVVLVNDGSFVVGTNYILQAKDFTKRIGQVDTSDAAIKTAAGVKLYEKATGNVSVSTVNITDKGGYTATVGTYDIVFQVANETSTTSTITATVSAGNAPVLNVPAFTEINVNDPFNQLTGVTATDTEDGNLINDVVVTGSVNVSTPGVYTLNYSVTDSDGNSASKTQIVLVNDGNFVVGNNYILQANNFTKRIGQVDTTDAAIKTAAGIKLYEKATGDESSLTVNVVDKDGYSANVGTYNIQFEVASEPTTTKTIVASVITGNNPVLTVPAFTEIDVNDPFNPLTGVSANDSEDGNITGDIQVSGSVNTAAAGVYTLTYTVSDSDNNTVTAKQVVLVNDETFVAGNNYIIQAIDFTKRISQVDTSATAIKTAAAVKVYEKATGNVSSQTVNIVDDGGYTAAIGNYNIEFEVASDTAATQTITATVSTGNVPVLTVPAFTEINVNDSLNPLTGVSATDTEDGNLINDVVVSGSVNTAIAGVYTLNYSVTDADNNTVTARQVVLVNDGTYVAGNTYIIKASNFTKRISQVNTSDAAIKTAAGVAVYEKATGIISGEVVNVVDDGGYNASVGTYDIVFEVANETTTTSTITATVSAGNAPVLSAPTFTEINVNDPFNQLTGVSATDTEDGDLINDVQISGSVNTAVAGVYALQYSVTDSDGNTVSKTQVVLVNDGTFVAGTDFILQAKNFTKRIGQVDTSDAAIKTAAGVKLYEKVTGDESSLTVNVIDKGGYSAAVGTYNIRFQIADEPTIIKTIVATVITGNNPVLTVPAFTEIDVNDPFNPLTGASASDSEDGNITGDIQVGGSVNTAVAGVYTLNYSITDSDNNTVTAKQIVLVNDGNFVVGNTYILFASNFTKRIGEVDNSDSAIKEAAGIKLYEKATGAISTTNVNITDDGGYSANVDIYTITFETTGDSTATRTIEATVTNGEVPVLTVPSFTEIAINGAFDPKGGVSANDAEDGNITDDIIINNSVDSSVAGVYPLKYTITDSDGNEVTKTQVVLVNDGNFTIGSTFIIQAQDFAVGLGHVNTNPTAVKGMAKVKVYEKATSLEDSEAVNIADDGGYTAALGSYNIKFEVASDTAANVTIQADVVTGEIPILTAPAFTEINVNDAFNPLTGVTATDIEDGNLIGDVQVAGTVTNTAPGVYTLTYTLTDSDLNTVTARQVVLVNDGTYILGSSNIFKASDFTRRVGQVNTAAAELRLAANTKVFSLSTGDEITSASINIDNRGGYTNAVGSYDITFSIGGDALALQTIRATVIAGDTPSLNVPSFSEINVNDPFNPLTGVTATDTEDGNLIGDVEVDGNVDNTVAGVYKLTYSITDSDENTVTATRVVLVNDGTFVAGNNYILKATDFTKRVGQVDTSAAAIKIAANIMVYEKTTGNVSSEVVNIVDNGGYTATVFNYNIEFEVASDSTANQTITASVITGGIPVLTAPAFTEINVNGSFNPLIGVTASDTEDGNLIADVQISGSVDRTKAGVYTLNYSVTDSDLNTVLAKQVVLVNDGTYAVGDTYLLQANDFSRRVGQVDTDPAAIKNAASVKVFEKATGDESSTTVNISDDDGYTAAVATYNIKFEVAGDAAATKTIIATVVAGQLPVLTVPAFSEINVNDPFNPLTGVTATDAEDGNIIGDVQVSGTVNPAVAGVYILTYSITDSDSNTVEATQVVLVNNGSFVVGDTYLLQANDFSILVGDVDTNAAAIKSAANVKVYEKATGLESSTTVNIADDGGYTAALGSYNIKFEVASDTAATKTITATVTAGQLPVLTVPAFTEINVNDSFDPLDGVSAIDVEDGDITNLVQVSGTVNTATAGVYTLTYSITDDDGNTVTDKQIVLVNDGSYVAGDTYLLKANDFTKRVGQVDTSDAAIKVAAGVKVYEKATGLESSTSVSILDKGGYTTNAGTYSIGFEVTGDAAANKTISATVITGDTPTLNAPAFSEVNINESFNPLTGVSANDTEDGNLIANVQVAGSVNSSIAGVYVLNYSVTDSDGNIATAKQIVVVNDGSFAVGDTYILKANNFSRAISKVDTDDAAIKIAAGVKVYEKATGIESNTSVAILDKGGYTNVLGTYDIKFEVTGDSGANIGVVATVTTGKIPVIKAPTFTNLKVDANFNPMSGVKATDAEDGDITSSIEITGKVDTSKVGIYHLVYSVTDNDGNKVSLKRVVLVNDGSFVYDNGFIIQAFDFKIGVTKANITNAKMVELAKVKVYDVKNQKWLENPNIKVDRNNFDNVVGKYLITFTFNPKITISATVYDNLPDSGSNINSVGISVLLLAGGSILLVVSRRRKNNNI